jgi:hypothetical protein
MDGVEVDSHAAGLAQTSELSRHARLPKKKGSSSIRLREAINELTRVCNLLAKGNGDYATLLAPEEAYGSSVHPLLQNCFPCLLKILLLCTPFRRTSSS